MPLPCAAHHNHPRHRRRAHRTMPASPELLGHPPSCTVLVFVSLFLNCLGFSQHENEQGPQTGQHQNQKTLGSADHPPSPPSRPNPPNDGSHPRPLQGPHGRPPAREKRAKIAFPGIWLTFRCGGSPFPLSMFYQRAVWFGFPACHPSPVFLLKRNLFCLPPPRRSSNDGWARGLSWSVLLRFVMTQLPCDARTKRKSTGDAGGNTASVWRATPRCDQRLSRTASM